MLFRIVVILGGVQLFGAWFYAKEWTVQEVQALEHEAHLTGSCWYLEYKNIN